VLAFFDRTEELFNLLRLFIDSLLQAPHLQLQFSRVRVVRKIHLFSVYLEEYRQKDFVLYLVHKLSIFKLFVNLLLQQHLNLCGLVAWVQQ
jgi:hypothetical protein